jgi:DNA-binding transcriptional ArsR family regulator
MDPVFRAIADPTRRQMLQRLAKGCRPASELGAGLSMSQPAVSQHLKVLREAGLVSATKQGRQQVYALQPEGLKAVFAWVTSFEEFWEERLDALDALLDELPDEPSDESPEPGPAPEGERDA